MAGLIARGRVTGVMRQVQKRCAFAMLNALNAYQNKVLRTDCVTSLS